MRWHEIVEDAETDPRYINDKVFKDPDHPIIKDRGAWGSSHSNSQAITGHAANVMGIGGYKPYSDDRYITKLAVKKLIAIARSPGTKEPLYHGFQNRKHIEWKVGDILNLPLTATAGEMHDVVGYGLRLDPKDNEGPPTVFEFPKGTKIVGYNKWKPEDAKDFGHHWSEAITAGKFRIIGVRTEHTQNWRKYPFTVVRLEPVSYFDPEQNAWVNY